MKTEWKNFLQQRGAEWTDPDAPLAHFGNPAQELSVTLSGEVMVDLDHRGLIAVSGEEAESFLQNLLSNDVRLVSESQSQLTSLNTAKGRMLALMRLFKREGVFYLSLPRSMVEPTLKRLRMYVLRSKVSLEAANDAFVQFGLSGTHAAERLSHVLGAAPDAPYALQQVAGISIIRLPCGRSGQQRFEMYGELEPMQKLWQALDVHATPVGSTSWDLLDTLAALPEVYPATVEAFVPQMANLERIGGVSFKKGCYPGQEIVARMHYLGKPARRMVLLRAPEAEPVMPGTAIFGSDAEPSVGEVVRSAAHPDGGCVLLAVLRLNALIANQDQTAPSEPSLHLGAANGALLIQLPLPYALEDDAA
ncbi:MAG: folate-binding protein [Halothiobacillaceae bacterium]|nr:folate-binding protein [Halothiobacillaceae bacterium]